MGTILTSSTRRSPDGQTDAVPKTKSATDPRGPAPTRILRSSHLSSESLDPVQCNALVDILYGIYNMTTYGCTRDEFAAVVFGAGDGRFVLFYDALDEFAGFSYAAFDYLEVAGRKHAVINAGVFFRPGNRGGAAAALFGLRQALRFKLREPRTPLAYVTRSSSPAVYRLLASTMPRLYPSRRHQTPDDVDALARAVSDRRSYVPVGASPWIVRSQAIPRDVSRMRPLEHDPDVQFYNALNPGSAEGESLLIWIPLDVANIVGGLFRLLRARLARSA
jgi:hypothetical protein